MTGKSRLLQSHWRIRACIEEAAEILGDVERLPDWWGDVYLDVAVLDPGGEDGLGRRIGFHSRGFLPYTLRWQGTIVEAARPHRWVIAAEGDLSGQGLWRLMQDGEIADIRYDWHVDVDRQRIGLRRLDPGD